MKRKLRKAQVATISRAQEKFECWAGNLFVNETMALRDHAMIGKKGWLEFTARDVAGNFDSMRDFFCQVLGRTKKFEQVRKILEAMLKGPHSEKFFELLARCFVDVEDGGIVPIRYDRSPIKEDIEIARKIALEPFRKRPDHEAARELKMDVRTYRKRKSRIKKMREQQLECLFKPHVTKKL